MAGCWFEGLYQLVLSRLWIVFKSFRILENFLHNDLPTPWDLDTAEMCETNIRFWVTVFYILLPNKLICVTQPCKLITQLACKKMSQLQKLIEFSSFPWCRMKYVSVRRLVNTCMTSCFDQFSINRISCTTKTANVQAQFQRIFTYQLHSCSHTYFGLVPWQCDIARVYVGLDPQLSLLQCRAILAFSSHDKNKWCWSSESAPTNYRNSAFT